MITSDGFKSRKLWLIVFSEILVTTGTLCCAKIPTLAPILATFCGTITALCGLYAASNIGEKHVLANQKPATTKLTAPVITEE